MSSRRLSLNKIVIIGLILLDVLLCFLLVKKHKEYRQAIYGYREEATLYLHAFNSSMKASATIGTLELASELNRLGILGQLQNIRGVGLFLPPHPCEACLDSELDVIRHFQEDSGLNVIIVAPVARERDLLAHFSMSSKFTIVCYDVENMSYPPLKENEGVVYFLSVNGRPEEVFVTSKYSEDASLLYLSKYMPLYE